jgi:hypothetical protein
MGAGKFSILLYRQSIVNEINFFCQNNDKEVQLLFVNNNICFQELMSLCQRKVQKSARHRVANKFK